MMAVINGERIFVGLLTMTNEKGQIRICALVPTKAHSQFVIALTRMWESCEKYGLPRPRIVFTDNMSDKDFLEASLPSLRDGIRPVTKFDHLPKLDIPMSVQIHVKKSLSQIEDVVLSLVASLSEDEGEKMYIALDTEWNVDLEARRRNIPDRRSTAIVQIATRNNVWILQVSAAPLLLSYKPLLKLIYNS